MTYSVDIEGRIRRHRKRIPVWLSITFGVLTTCSLMLAISLSPLVVYNYRRIRAQRAATTIDDFAKVALPLLQAIYNSTVGPDSAPDNLRR